MIFRPTLYILGRPASLSASFPFPCFVLPVPCSPVWAGSRAVTALTMPLSLGEGYHAARLTLTDEQTPAVATAQGSSAALGEGLDRGTEQDGWLSGRHAMSEGEGNGLEEGPILDRKRGHVESLIDCLCL